MTIVTYPFLLPNYYTKTFDGKMKFPGVPYIKSYYEYIDLNEDKNLQKNVTKFFFDELMNDWISKAPSQRLIKVVPHQKLNVRSAFE